jgi:hypothetical protein
MSLEDEGSDFQSILEGIFQLSPENSNRVISRESTTVEFKASFHEKTNKWDEYGKTIAAFANTKGGCLVFGVKNKPHDLVGLGNDYFDEFDPAELTSFLNSRFSPEIAWSKHTHFIEDKKFGLIRIYECSNKPVVAISNGGSHIKDAEIYYRYRGRSEKIRYSELRKILEEIRKTEQMLWMKHISRIASVGVSNAAIFNPDDGTVAGKAGTFVIDKSLLPKLSFIREGEFREVAGSPAIKLVGEAQILAAGEVTGIESIERKAVRLNEIIEFFLFQKKPSEPRFFIEQACYEQSGFLPLYYYASIAGLSLDELKAVVEKEKSRNQSKSKIVERLANGDNSLYKSIPNTGTIPALEKGEIRKGFIERKLDDNNSSDPRYVLEVLRSLRKDEIDVEYVFSVLRKYYKDFWDKDSTFRDGFRRAICHLDKELFCPENFYR